MVRFTEAEVVEVWDRWQAGDVNRLIGRDLGRSAASIRAFVESWGGVRPEPRRRSLRHLSFDEREEISRRHTAGDSMGVAFGDSAPSHHCARCRPRLRSQSPVGRVGRPRRDRRHEGGNRIAGTDHAQRPGHQ